MPYIPRKVNSRRNKGTVWVEGMRLPRGKAHSGEFYRRILEPVREVGSGIIKDPKILWLLCDQYTELPITIEGYLAIERIVREEVSRLGLTHAWISKESHGLSTVKTTRTARVMSHDDWHITLRIGSSEDICNLHGHFYLIYENNDVSGRAIRMMREDERGVVGGKNPQLWVWGDYPDTYPRQNAKYPETPFEIVAGSILDKQVMQQRR